MVNKIRNRQVLFAKRPVGMPDESCFKIETQFVEFPKEGQVLIRNYYLSLDPYIRMRMEPHDSYAPVMKLGDVMVGRTIGKVIDSKVPSLPVDTWVVGRLGWQDYSIAQSNEVQVIKPNKAPLTSYLGALGSTGITAWLGLMHIASVKPGERVLVSAASGAVGSTAGQLAKWKGCQAIGIAGGANKCKLVRERFGFDDCIDYKSPDFLDNLNKSGKDGFDVYFDNVGGMILDASLPLMRLKGRIPLCGLVSQYNATKPYGVQNMREVFNKRLTIQGFVISDHQDLWPLAITDLETAYTSGDLVYEETIHCGLENAPSSFVGMLQGRNIGKQLIQITEK